jgi:hypothetical protein
LNIRALRPDRLDDISRNIGHAHAQSLESGAGAVVVDTELREYGGVEERGP